MTYFAVHGKSMDPVPQIRYKVNEVYFRKT